MIDFDPSKICSNLKCRRTKLRLALGHIFHESKTPLSAIDIQKKLLSKNIKVNKTSIYRELKFLTKNFILKEVQIDGISTKYEFNTNNHKSYLICANCNKIIPFEIDNKSFNSELKKISQQKKFTINSHSLIFFGHCHKCHQNNL